MPRADFVHFISIVGKLLAMIPKSFEDALARVKLLAERFRQNEAVYLSPKYLEAEVRQDFLVYQLYDITPDERRIIEGT